MHRQNSNCSLPPPTIASLHSQMDSRSNTNHLAERKTNTRMRSARAIHIVTSTFAILASSMSAGVTTVTAQGAAVHPATPAAAPREETLQEMAALSAAKSPEITMAVTQTEKELLLSFGPLELPAHAKRDGGVPEPPPRWIIIPKDSWIHGYWVELVDKNGAKVPLSTL